MPGCSITLGGKQCLHPGVTIQQMRALNLETHYIEGLANSFRCPLGAEPGRGWVLMLREDLDALDLNAVHTLTFSDFTTAIDLKVYIVRGICVTPGWQDDGKRAYCVEVVDRRFAGRFSYINKQFNVPTYKWATGENFYTASKNSGTAWTWDDAIQHIWERMSWLGTWPGLPAGWTVTDSPNNYRFVGVRAYDALNAVLESLGLALAYDPIADSFSVVLIGDADTADPDFAPSRNQLIIDADVVESEVCRVPDKFGACFNQHDRNYGDDASDLHGNDHWELNPIYEKEVSSGVTGVLTGTKMPIWGEMIARFNAAGSTPANQTNVDNRATALANDWKDRIQRNELVRKVFSGVHDYRPGARITGVCWRFLGGMGSGPNLGVQTEVICSPNLLNPITWFNQWWGPSYVRDFQSPPHLARQRPLSMPIIHGTLDGDLTRNNSATLSVKYYDGTDTTQNETVYDYHGLGTTIVSGTKVSAYWDDQVGKWIAFVAGCPAP